MILTKLLIIGQQAENKETAKIKEEVTSSTPNGLY